MAHRVGGVRPDAEHHRPAEVAHVVDVLPQRGQVAARPPRRRRRRARRASPARTAGRTASPTARRTSWCPRRARPPRTPAPSARHRRQRRRRGPRRAAPAGPRRPRRRRTTASAGRASSAAWTRLALRSPVTPSGSVAQPSAAASGGERGVVGHHHHLGRRGGGQGGGDGVAGERGGERRALLVGQPGQPGLAQGGRLDRHQDGEADGGVGRGGHRGDPPIRASARGSDPGSDLPVACCRRTAAPGPWAEE